MPHHKKLSATAALAERNDVIIISSVSCIYGLGDPVDYKEMVVSLRPGMEKDRDEVLRKLIDLPVVVIAEKGGHFVVVMHTPRMALTGNRNFIAFR